MRVLVTAGPTREYIDSVRFITNASSGRMGCAVAEAAIKAGHDVTLLRGPVAWPEPTDCRVVGFTSVDDLKGALYESFDACDALVMAAAVGDYRPENTVAEKLSRRDGPITLRLFPTEDLLAGLRSRKRRGQIVVAFAVEEGPPERIEAKAREELTEKGADFVVVNTPAAIDAARSDACILSPAGVILPWAFRPKEELAAEIVKLLA